MIGRPCSNSPSDGPWRAWRAKKYGSLGRVWRRAQEPAGTPTLVARPPAQGTLEVHKCVHTLWNAACATQFRMDGLGTLSSIKVLSFAALAVSTSCIGHRRSVPRRHEQWRARHQRLGPHAPRRREARGALLRCGGDRAPLPESRVLEIPVTQKGRRLLRLLYASRRPCTGDERGEERRGSDQIEQATVRRPRQPRASTSCRQLAMIVATRVVGGSGRGPRRRFRQYGSRMRIVSVTDDQPSRNVAQHRDDEHGVSSFWEA